MEVSGLVMKPVEAVTVWGSLVESADKLVELSDGGQFTCVVVAASCPPSLVAVAMTSVDPKGRVVGKAVVVRWSFVTVTEKRWK